MADYYQVISDKENDHEIPSDSKYQLLSHPDAGFIDLKG